MKLSKNKLPLELSVINNYEDKKTGIYKSCHPKVQAAREEGIKNFVNHSLPLSNTEAWRNTNISQLYKNNYLIGDEKPVFDKQINEIFTCTVQGFDTNVFAMLNGWYYSSDKEQIKVLADGVIVGSIRAAQQKYPELISKYFNQIAQKNHHGFHSANAAVFSDGIFIYVPDNVEAEKAIQLIKMVNRDNDIMVNSRNLIVLGKNSKLSFLHCDDSINQHHGLLNTNTEIFLEENAELNLYKLQNLNNNTTLINSTFVGQQKNSELNINILTFNGGTIRNEINVDLQDEGAHANLSGIYLMDNNQHIDNQLYIKHSAPNCTSNQMFKGVLDDKASAVFKGSVYVARNAQNTVAFQKNANILMTSEASIDTMPFLEIYADDVKCSHGATVGQLDNEAMFYLMQRGISKSDAKLLLMYAFTAEVTDKISIEALKTNVDDMIKKRLRGDLSICDSCVLHCSTPDIPIFDIDMSKI